MQARAQERAGVLSEALRAGIVVEGVDLARSRRGWAVASGNSRAGRRRGVFTLAAA